MTKTFSRLSGHRKKTEGGIEGRMEQNKNNLNVGKFLYLSFYPIK